MTAVDMTFSPIPDVRSVHLLWRTTVSVPQPKSIAPAESMAAAPFPASETWQYQRTGRNAARLSEPARDARNGLAHLVGRARVGKPDEAAAVNRIEVDAGSSGDMCLFQHLRGKCEAVGGEFRDVGVQIKGAVSGKEFG